MQKLTHTSHLWRLGGRQPIPGVWLVPPLNTPRPTNYCFLVERVGAKNKVDIALLAYDYSEGQIQYVLRKSEVRAENMSWELMKMNQQYLAQNPRLRYTSWSVSTGMNSMFLRNLSDAFIVYINSIEGVDIPAYGIISPS